jgi:hypothetical protein
MKFFLKSNDVVQVNHPIQLAFVDDLGLYIAKGISHWLMLKTLG